MEISGRRGFDDRHVEVTISDVSSDDNTTSMSGWLFDNSLYSASNPVLKLVCHSLLCGGDEIPDESADISTYQFLTLMSDSKPPYGLTMKMFEEIPTMTEIKSSIFKDAHHEPYNIAGSKTFHVRGTRIGGGDDWEANYPILCNISNPNAAGEFVAGQSSISCGVADSTTWDSGGRPDDTSVYRSYFALQDRDRPETAVEVICITA